MTSGSGFGPTNDNEWISRDAWCEGLYRSCGCGPSVGEYGADGCLGRHHRGSAGARLSEQSAAQRAARLGQVDRRERAAGAVRLSPARRGHRQRRLPVHRYAEHRGRHAHHHRSNRHSRRQLAAQHRRHRDADAVQRPADRQPDPRGGEPGFGRARSVAGARTDRAAAGGHHLHGLSARLRDRRSSEEQRPRARTDAEADQGPFQRRRGDAHRRRAIRGAARRGQYPVADRRSQSDDDAVELPPHHRQRAVGTGAGLAGRPLPAGYAALRGRSRPDAKSQRDRRDVRHRCQLSPGQDQRRRAAAHGDAGRPPCSSPTNRP